MKNKILLNFISAVLIILSIVGICFIINDARIVPSNEEQVINEMPQMPTNEQPNMDRGNRGEMSADSNYQPQPTMPNEQVPNDNFGQNRENQNITPSHEVVLTNIQVVLFVICVLIMIINVMMMIYTRFYSKQLNEVFINRDKVIIFVLLSLLVSGMVSFIIWLSAINMPVIVEEESSNETTGDDISSGEKVNAKDIDLNDYDTNVTITEAGIYTLSGELNHAILIDANGKVTLNLNGVTINSDETAAIANRTENDLVINIMEGTTNNLTDGGNSEYDGSLYSNGHLYIEGNGTLNIYGKQSEGEGIATTDNDITISGGTIYIESNDDGINAGGDVGGTITINGGTIQIKASGDGIDSNDNIVINGGTVYAMGSANGGDAGIDADNGFEINGGLVIGLGSDMLESPNNSSKQSVICFNLDEVIKENTLITLVDSNENVIVSFVAKEDFRTLIISSEDLENGTYSLYKNGTNNGELVNNIYVNSDYENGDIITITNKTEFNINSNITRVE